LDRRHRAVCLENLAIAFPEKDQRERLAILRGSYEHLGLCAADFCHFNKIKPEEVRGAWVVPEEGADELMRKALAQKRGVICVAAHIGFWELSGFAYPSLGYPVVSVSRRIAAPRLEALANRIRTRLGNIVVHKEGALRPLLRALQENKCIGVVMDQRAGREGPWVQFFTRPASTVDTCARLHIKTGAPLISNLTIRRADGRYTWRCRQIAVPPQDGRSNDEYAKAILRAIHCDLEEAIRETPEQWLWVYKRWKGSDAWRMPGGECRVTGKNSKSETRNPKETEKCKNTNQRN
jgi:KDO2-lipid IV(A) lauroyltransferase